MNKFSLSNVRKMWIDFFISKNHTFFPSQSLVPKNDNSLLWINSGVATLKNFFSGKDSPVSNRLVNSQRCIRTNDIENVGISSRHNTFFEMLGNFSIGDYFRKEAIEFGFEFLTKILKIDTSLLYITVFKDDNESYELWQRLGIAKNHILKCDKDRNFWEIGNGPCGPCTEIYYDRGVEYDHNKIGEKLFFEDIENDRYIEIWNIVFSEFEKNDNELIPLTRKNIDTGSGLERLCCILQNVPTNYDIDVFNNVKEIIAKKSIYKYDINLLFESNKLIKQTFINKSYAVIIDHFRAVVFSISDGVLVSSKGRGYILRKLIRRIYFYFSFLHLKKNLVEEIVNQIANDMKDFYPHILDNQKKIIELVNEEFNLYAKAIDNSFHYFFELIQKNNLNEKTLFHLVDTYGFPIEIINELQNCSDQLLLNEIVNLFNQSNKEINLNLLKINFSKFLSYMDNHKEISKSHVVKNALEKQNTALLELNLDSIFDYDNFECQSKVIKIYDHNFNEVNNIEKQNCYLVLDKTCFYATSGGQKNDEGIINNFKVVDVFKAPNGQNIHVIEAGTFSVNDIVDCKINKEKRLLVSKNHTFEHLLQCVLQKVISKEIKQEGAFKSFEKVTFDFNYDKKLSFDQILLVENEIQKIIDLSIPKQTFLFTLDEAKQHGAIAYFEDVYKKIKGKLRAVKFDDCSFEICGGTHVNNTKEIEANKIIKIESKGSNNWRIEAITSSSTLKAFFDSYELPLYSEYKNLKKLLSKYEKDNSDLKNLLNMDFESKHYLEKKCIVDKLNDMLNYFKNIELKNKDEEESINLKNTFLKQTNQKINLFETKGLSGPIIFKALSTLINEDKNSIFFAINKNETFFQYYLCCNPNNLLNTKINFNVYSSKINSSCVGKGGGKPNFVQGSFTNYNKEIISILIEEIKNEFK